MKYNSVFVIAILAALAPAALAIAQQPPPAGAVPGTSPAAVVIPAPAASPSAAPLSLEKLGEAMQACAAHIKAAPGTMVRPSAPSAWQFASDRQADCATLRDEYVRRLQAATDDAKHQQVRDAAKALQGGTP